MANIRINDLPADATPSASDVVAIDQATTRKATIQDVCDVGIPVASQIEAEAGVDDTKRMTPLKTAQAIAAQGVGLFATQAQGDLADTAVQLADLAGYVQATRTVSAGTGLDGGGDLSANRTLSLSSATQASLGLADSAIQASDLGALATMDTVTTAEITATGTPSAATFLSGAGTWATPAGAGDLLAANNLSDLANAATARTNLGLGNVDNTSDANKPVSTAQQTALDLKAPLLSPTFTGTPAAPTAANAVNSTQLATTAFVKTSQYNKSVVVLSSSGNYTVPDGVYAINVQTWGGGGGGGASGSAGQCAGGGGGGGYSNAMLAVTPGQIIAYTIGAGGAGTGAAGGATTFGTLTANGGNGGNPNPAGAGGTGGTASGGTVNLPGSPGGSGDSGTSPVYGGAGGNSAMGGNGGPFSQGTNNGLVPGGGGSGRGFAGAANGGIGGAGLIIITY